MASVLPSSLRRISPRAGVRCSFLANSRGLQTYTYAFLPSPVNGNGDIITSMSAPGLFLTLFRTRYLPKSPEIFWLLPEGVWGSECYWHLVGRGEPDNAQDSPS